jgi:uncharacterized protein
MGIDVKQVFDTVATAAEIARRGTIGMPIGRLVKITAQQRMVCRGRTILFPAVFAIVVVCGLASVGNGQDLAGLEKSLLFFPTRNIARTPEKIGLKFENVSLIAADHVKIDAWWVPHENARATLLFSHGNGGNISDRLDKLKIFHDLGLNVLLYDYRGYGKSEGSPSEAGFHADVQTAYDFLVKEHKIPPEKIIAYGESLGGSIAAHLAANNRVGALILDSSFTSLKDMARTHYPLLAGLVQSSFNTLADTAKVQSPVLVLHSPTDEIVPYSQGKQLFQVANEPKQFVKLRGDHNSGFLKSRKVYVKGLDTFLKTQLAHEHKDAPDP